MTVLVILNFILSIFSIIAIGFICKYLIKGPVKKQGTLFKDDWVYVEHTEHSFTKEIVQTRHYFTFYEVTRKPFGMLSRLRKCVGCSSIGSTYSFKANEPCPNCGTHSMVDCVGRVFYTEENLPNWEIIDCSKRED